MAEQQEEDEIAWLEHQLYGRKRKHHIEGDDVDDLLDDLDQFHPGMYDEDEGDHTDLAGLCLLYTSDAADEGLGVVPACEDVA